MQKPNQNIIETSLIDWRNDPASSQLSKLQPYSVLFQDVYYSSDNGLLETDYVFLQGNQLSSRWQQLENTTFTIIETGFGTALNFLSAAQLWLRFAPKEAVLHFISTEKYPLKPQEMAKALQAWPELTKLSAQFLEQYQQSDQTEAQETFALFDNRVKLTLLYGDATASLATTEFVADAWFLDGFSPAKNPDMWQTALFTEMARLSKTGTTFATFTSAGVVKRGLQATGFTVHKRSGFGKKREMLIGVFKSTYQQESLSGKHQ